MKLFSLLLLSIFLWLMGCAGVPSNVSKLRKIVYILSPQSISAGVSFPADTQKLESRSLITISGTWQIRPFIPPTPNPVFHEP